MPFVLDSSVALAWVLPDEANPQLDHVCDRMADDIALVPPVWPLEIGNVLLIGATHGSGSESSDHGTSCVACGN